VKRLNSGTDKTHIYLGVLQDRKDKTISEGTPMGFEAVWWFCLLCPHKVRERKPLGFQEKIVVVYIPIEDDGNEKKYKLIKKFTFFIFYQFTFIFCFPKNAISTKYFTITMSYL